MSENVTTYTEEDGEAIAELLVGRRIVSAEKGDFDCPGRSSSDKRAEGRLVLDDGGTLDLTGHDGGCSWSSGGFALDKGRTRAPRPPRRTAAGGARPGRGGHPA